MPDESWALTDEVLGSEALEFYDLKPLSDGMAHSEAYPWTVGIPFNDSGVLTESLIIGIPLRDSLAGSEALEFYDLKPLGDDLATADEWEWSGGWPQNDLLACVDAITEFDRVIWKLTLGRW